MCTNTLTFHNDCSRFEAAAKKGEREWVKNNIIRREGGVSAAAESIRSA